MVSSKTQLAIAACLATAATAFDSISVPTDITAGQDFTLTVTTNNSDSAYASYRVYLDTTPPGYSGGPSCKSFQAKLEKGKELALLTGSPHRLPGKHNLHQHNNPPIEHPPSIWSRWHILLCRNKGVSLGHRLHVLKLIQPNRRNGQLVDVRGLSQRHPIMACR